jgi:BolA protein
MELRITARLREDFAPAELRVTNESHMHSVPEGSETHFRVLVVSDAFAGLPLVQRHRRIHAALRGELADGLHALAIEALLPSDWQARGGVTAESPLCRGGSKPS